MPLFHTASLGVAKSDPVEASFTCLLSVLWVPLVNAKKEAEETSK